MILLGKKEKEALSSLELETSVYLMVAKEVVSCNSSLNTQT